jgi:ornithine cyclodeaminase/alanine dehydrogenase-like protein (mu-crystallin family)
MTAAPIYLTEADVGRLATVKDAITVLEELFATWGQPSTSNLPRQRARLPGGAFNLMGAAYGAKNVYGLKAYAGMKGGQFHTLLYSSLDGRLKAMIEADLFGQLRTGERACHQAARQAGCTDARPHRRRAAIAHAGACGVRSAADQARQRLCPHGGEPRGLCARDGEGSRD